MPDDQTLSDALLSEGVSHKPSKIVGKRDLFDGDGNLIGSFDAAEGWAWINERTA